MAITYKDDVQSQETIPPALTDGANPLAATAPEATADDGLLVTHQAPEAEDAGPLKASVTLETLNEAAENLMSQLMSRGADLIRDVSVTQNVPLWMVVVGLLQRSIDTGEYTAPILDPIWLRGTPSVLSAHGFTECECGCGTTFQRRWPGQLYVDSKHSADHLHRIAPRKDRRVSLPPVGKEPHNALRSTITQAEGQPTPYGSYDPATGPPGT